MEKLRIGLTQRVEVVTSYGERRDCLDQEWSILLRQLDFIPIPLPNQIGNVEEHLESLRLDGLIFTGGNDLQVNAGGTNLAPERDQFESELIEISSSTGLRLLGVCRGLQHLPPAAERRDHQLR